jgi:TRAP-type mannitol/chloroaromatic compound transport system substrate-binding protein
MIMGKKMKGLMVGGLVLAIVVSLVFGACAPKAPAGEVVPKEELTKAQADLAAEKQNTAAADKKAKDLEAELAAAQKPAKVWEIPMQANSYAGVFKDELDSMAADVEAMTQGRIKLTGCQHGTIVPATEAIRALGDGTLLVAQVYPGYFTSEIPLSFVESGIPGTLKTWAEVQEYMEGKGVRKVLDDEWAKHNVKRIGTYAMVCEGFASNVPIYHVQDLRGVKFRSSDIIAEGLAALGASTMYAPSSDIYMLLANATVDAATSSDPAVNYGRGWAEVTKYWQTPPLLRDWVGMPVFASMDWWNALSKDCQLALENRIAAGSERFARTCLNATWKILDKVQTENKIQLITWDANDMAIWESTIKKITLEKYSNDPATKEVLDILWNYLGQIR